MRSRINRWYKDLQTIEEEIEAREPNADIGPKLDELDRLDANVGRVGPSRLCQSALHAAQFLSDLGRAP